MYTIHTPNTEYDGEWNGVTFTNGVGHTQDSRVAEEAKWLGYKVTGSKPADKPVEAPTEAPETPAQAPKKRAPRKKASA